MDYVGILTMLAMAAGPYATINEGLIVGMVIKPMLEKMGVKVNPMVISLFTGIIMALVLNIDFAGPVIHESFGIDVPYVGLIISGLFIGRVSNYIHDKWPVKPQ